MIFLTACIRSLTIDLIFAFYSFLFGKLVMHRSCKGCKLDDDVRHVTWIALRDITVLGCNNIGFVSLCTGEEQNKEALQDVEDETQ